MEEWWVLLLVLLAYYHLNPDDSRVMWDTLLGIWHRVGLSCLFGLLLVVLLSMSYERKFNDLRLYMMFQLIPCIAIPGMTYLYPPKYTHSIYWLWAAGICLVAKFEAALDRKIYRANNYFISGHSLEHLGSAVVPVVFTIMLMCRNIRIQR